MVMIRNRDILNCLPLLASVLGNRYGVKVRIGGDKAYTNGKIIQIPALPLDCDTTAIALAKGYVDHEAAHIRYTDFTALRKAASKPLVKHLCNSIEDWRVEKRLGELYPGCRANLAWLAKFVFLDETEGAGTNPASSVLNYVLLFLRSRAVPELGLVAEDIKEELAPVYPGLTDRLDSILARVLLECPDSQAAHDYALELADVIVSYAPEHPALGSGGERREEKAREDVESAASPDDSEGSAQDNPQADRAQVRPVPDKGEPQSGTDESARGQTDPAGEETDQEQALRELKALAGKREEELPRGIGELIAEKLAESSCVNCGNGLEVATCMERITEKLPEEEIKDALQSSNALRQRLAGLLQAQELRRIAPSRNGKLHTGKLHKLAIGNPRVFSKEDSVKGRRTAVHILLDTSGSMANDRIRLARQACFAVAKALSSIKGINPAVTAFPDVRTGGVYPLLKHGNRLTDRSLVEADGGTPLAPALWWVSQTLYPMPEQRKIILVITDGVPDNRQAALEAINRIGKLGMEVYGIGIQLEMVRDLFPGRARVIRSLADLASAMFGLLQDTLIRGGENDGSH